MSAANRVSQIVAGSKIPAAIATPEKLSTTPLLCSSVTIIAGRVRAANTGSVYIGNASANDAQTFPLAAGASIQLFAGDDELLDLSQIYVDSVNVGDGVQFLAVAPANQ